MNLGRWGGLQVRLHVFFLLFAAFTLLLGWHERERDPALVWIAVGSLVILFVSVLVHELGHYLAAMQYGGDAEEIVIGPLGGLAPMRPPAEPRAECLMYLAGPGANLVVCLLSGTALWVGSAVSLVGLLNPLAPQGLTVGAPWEIGLKLIFWINWVLLLANLLPAFPFDGGRALRMGLAAAWPDSSPRRAAMAVALLAKLSAAALVVVAWFVRDHGHQSVPMWFPLVILAIFLYFGARQEEERADEQESDEDLFGYDFSQGYTSLERSAEHRPERPGLLAQWLEQRRAARLRRQRETEAEEERRADEILALLHEKGLDGISEEERSLLKRVSARYRQRNSKQS